MRDNSPHHPWTWGVHSMIKQELLDILACPKCKEKVVLDQKAAHLVCRRCKLKYPINEQGIPIMLIDRAETLES